MLFRSYFTSVFRNVHFDSIWDGSAHFGIDNGFLLKPRNKNVSWRVLEKHERDGSGSLEWECRLCCFVILLPRPSPSPPTSILETNHHHCFLGSLNWPSKTILWCFVWGWGNGRCASHDDGAKYWYLTSSNTRETSGMGQKLTVNNSINSETILFINR